MVNRHCAHSAVKDYWTRHSQKYKKIKTLSNINYLHAIVILRVVPTLVSFLSYVTGHCEWPFKRSSKS